MFAPRLRKTIPMLLAVLLGLQALALRAPGPRESWLDLVPIEKLKASPAEFERALKGLDVSKLDAEHKGLIDYLLLFGGTPEHLKILARRGANIDLRDENGLSPLHFAAAAHRDPAVVETLIELGANPIARDAEGLTPLHYAVQGRHLANVLVLLKHGVPVDVRASKGHTPLHLAAIAGMEPRMIDLLLDHGADIEARDMAGNTPLHMAALNNPDPAFVERLVKRGANLEARNNPGWTPFIAAAAGNPNPEVLRTLVRLGANVHALAKGKKNALHVAAQLSSTPEIIELLLELGVDPTAKDYHGQLPVDLAKYNRSLRGTQAYWLLNDAAWKTH